MRVYECQQTIKQALARISLLESGLTDKEKALHEADLRIQELRGMNTALAKQFGDLVRESRAGVISGQQAIGACQPQQPVKPLTPITAVSWYKDAIDLLEAFGMAKNDAIKIIGIETVGKDCSMLVEGAFMAYMCDKYIVKS